MKLKSILFRRHAADGTTVLAAPVLPDRDATIDAVDWKGGAATQPVILPRTTAPAPRRLRVAVDGAPSGSVFIRGRNAAAQPLGNTTVARLDGDGTADLEVDAANLARARIGRQTMHWQWQYSGEGTRWVDFGETSHPIYVTHARPAPPWGLPGEAHAFVPWTAVVERACRWSDDGKSDAALLGSITEEVHDLGGRDVGGYPIQYVGGAATFASRFVFGTHDFLRMVDGAPSSAAFTMNCADTASAIAIFASCLGVPVRIAALLPSVVQACGGLRTNRIRIFGERGGCFQVFCFHEFAVAGGLGETGRVWDGCLRLDTDGTPHFAPERWALPRGLPRGSLPAQGGEPTYLGTLLLNRTQARVEWSGDAGIRYPRRVTGFAPAPDVPGALLRAYYQRIVPEPDARDVPGLELEDLTRALGGDVSTGIRSADVAPAAAHAFLTFRWQPDLDNAGRVFAGVGVAASADQAREVLIDLAAGAQNFLQPCGSDGFALVAPDTQTLLMQRGPFVVRLVSDPRAPHAVFPAAALVSRLLRTA